MARAPILDAEALHAIARPKARTVLVQRARAILAIAHEERALVRVPSPVLAEVCRDRTLEAAVGAFLSRGISEVIELDEATARHAGRLLARHPLASSHAIDAFVIAAAATFSWSVVATGDPDDMTRLATGIRHVHVMSLRLVLREMPCESALDRRRDGWWVDGTDDRARDHVAPLRDHGGNAIGHRPARKAANAAAAS